MKASKSSLHPSADCSKENLTPAVLNSTPIPAKKKTSSDETEDQKKMADEIQKIETEIKRLSSRLEALRFQKAAGRTLERRGRIVLAKFMETKPIEETPKPKFSNGIMRRGMSLGPAEISGGGGRFSRWPATTQSRRKSCLWKPEQVDEITRNKSLSHSPKSKRNVVGPKQKQSAAATVVTRKIVKKEKEEGIAALVQPRKLFKEGEKSVPNKKQGRIVASRYSQVDLARKRSLPEKDDDDVGAGTKRRPASLRGSEVRVKKRWEIPNTTAAQDIMNGTLLLPKIRTVRYPNESPRDSGAAKRVADLTGQRSWFCHQYDDYALEEESVCQVLNFAEAAADEDG